MGTFSSAEAVQSDISDFGFEMQDSSDFKISNCPERFMGKGQACPRLVLPADFVQPQRVDDARTVIELFSP